LFDEAESEKISGGSPSECELQEYKIYLAKELASIDSLTPSTRKRVKKFLQQTLQRTSRLSRNAYTIQVRDAAEDALRALEAPSITFY
jgi:hypothetical protein